MCPVIDVINDDTFQYTGTGGTVTAVLSGDKYSTVDIDDPVFLYILPFRPACLLPPPRPPEKSHAELSHYCEVPDRVISGFQYKQNTE